MAIYHLSAKLLTRSAGHNAVAAAAYRSGSRLICHRTGTVHNFQRKTEVQHTAILAPDNAPSWVQERAILWNQVEDSEKRINAQLAREFVVAIPLEISHDSRSKLLDGYIRDAFVSMGMVADYAIHDKPGNPHAHIMLTLRELDATNNSFGAKQRDWNNPAHMDTWREKWANHVNAALASFGSRERIDHRSLKAQCISGPSTIHVGRDNGLNTDAVEGRTTFNAWVMALREIQRIKNDEAAISATLNAIRSEIIDLGTTLADALRERDASIGTNSAQLKEPARILVPRDADFTEEHPTPFRRPMKSYPKSTTTKEDTPCSIFLFPS